MYSLSFTTLIIRMNLSITTLAIWWWRIQRSWHLCCPPTYENGLIDEDSGPADAVDINILSYHQLRYPDTVPLNRSDKSVKHVGGFYSSSDDKYTDDPPPCNRKNSKCGKMPKNIIWAVKDISNEKQNDLKWRVPKPHFLDIYWCPISIFEEFMSDELLYLFFEQTLIHAKLKGSTSFSIRWKEMRPFPAILLTSDYPVSPQSLYWSNDIDINNKAVSSAMIELNLSRFCIASKC